MDYSGKIITKNAVTPTQTAASGVWTLDDALQAQKGNNWPIPGVPNPISKSLRFNSADSTHLNRVPTISLNPQKFTFSFWIKLCSLTTNVIGLWGSRGSPVVTRAEFGFYLNKFYFQNNNGSTWNVDLATVAVFRDVSAWYHIVIAVDTTQATASNRVRVYFNGVEQTLTGTTPAQNLNLDLLTTTSNSFIGTDLNTTGRFFDGYMTEYHLIDGQQLTPSDFGMTDTNTGVWIPKKYTGTYGTNGFYLNFKDASNTSTLGLDYSGNGNNWNANNFSVTAGAGNDSLTDVPTPWVGYSLNGDTGGVVRGNYCTWNPLAGTGSGVTGYGWTLANGNLDYTATNAGTYSNTMTSTFAVTTGKWYLEITIGSSPASSHPIIGVIETEDISLATSTSNFQTATYISTVRVTDGQKSVFGSTSYASYGSSLAAGDILNIAIDGDNGKIWWGKNGTWFNSGVPASGTNAGDTFTPGQSLSVLCIAYNANGTHVLNAGQRPFAYTAPSGFKALCTTNLPTPAIGATSTTRADDYFNIVLRSGFGSSGGTVTGVGFQPDFIWQKQRNGASNHYLTDAVRGGTKYMYSNTTDAEVTNANWITAFNSDGFTVGSADYATSETVVAWNWKANGAGSSNTAGSITSTVSANTTAGFSIVTWTGNGTQGATVGHGLGAVPALLIFKNRSVSATEWPVKTNQLATNAYLYLNATNASASYSFFWSAEPTSSLIYLGSDNRTNGSGNLMVCYAFAPVAGYSAFGSYTGNGSADGPFIYTGFRPAFVLIKATSSVSFGSWRIIDNKRSPSNVAKELLFPNLSNAEDTADWLDLTSNGFKIRQTSDGVNGNGSTYIYAAFAESPFKFANAR
jgi:hypothetical protein